MDGTGGTFLLLLSQVKMDLSGGYANFGLKFPPATAPSNSILVCIESSRKKCVTTNTSYGGYQEKCV